MGRKISVIGAGAVGATLAQRIIECSLADVILLDIAKNLAIGKSLDMLDAAPIVGHEKNILGTSDYNDIKDSDIVVITAGLPRKPGMTREELISKNASIVKEVSINVRQQAPGSIVIVVTNPLDAMTYLAYKTTSFKKERIMGMAGALDGSRFVQFLSEELKVPRSSIETFVLGSHGDTMVPVISKTFVSGKPVSKLIPPEKLSAIIKRTCDRGAEIVSYLGNGSAYYSPSAAVFKMVKAILNNTKEVMAVSAYLDGEYGLKDICIGIPCRIGRNGIEEIVRIELAKDEESALLRSAKVIKSSIELL